MSTALVVYSWPRLWSLGTGSGSPDFSHSLIALTRVFDRVTLLYPHRRGAPLERQVPPGVRAVGFAAWRLPLIGVSGGPRIARAVVLCLNWPLRLLNYFVFNLAAYRAAVRECSSAAPELLTAHGCAGVWAASRIARRAGVPLAVRMFGISLGMKGFSAPVLAAQFEEYVAFRIDAARWIITDDGSGGRAAAEKLGVPAEKISMLRAAVNRETDTVEPDQDRAACRSRLGLAPATIVVLRVCRLWNQQRVDRLIEALPRSTAGGVPVAAVVIGDGPERERLEQLALRLDKRVVFTGTLPNDSLAWYYRSADLYAATADRTNLSQSVLEALRHALPVVALDSGETASLIRDGINGRLVRPADNAALAEALAELMEDNDLRQKLADGAGRTAGEEIPTTPVRVAAEAEIFRQLTKT
ncbi:MAG: glycosyltransferase family 4 protein [Candidatus Glassbacteria bacterium]|nr:glycosyltransferase family 4 protein [Candidatus Glassbacteria bacterium]